MFTTSHLRDGLAMLRPQLAELSRIGGDHALALSRGTELREQLASLRARIRATTSRSAPRFDAATEFDKVESIASDLRRACDTEFELGAVQQVDEALARARKLAEAILRDEASGDRSSAVARVETLGDAAGEAISAADRIVLYNAGEVRNAAQAVHRALARAILLTSALGVLVVITAAILLRYAVHSVQEHTHRLERTAEDLGDFAARAAHEMRSPLQALALSLATLRPDGESLPKLDRARASTRRLASMLQEILDFSRSGGEIDGSASSGVAEVIGDLEREFSPVAAEAGVALRFHSSDDLEVAVAPGHLRIVLSNLVANAIKYGSRPGCVELLAGLDPRTPRVRITVHDDGPGIPADALVHVFEPFYRATARGDGYGLGLATVKRIVEAYHGTIDVTSDGGSGTTFAVELPRVSADRRERSPAGALPATARARGARTPR